MVKFILFVIYMVSVVLILYGADANISWCVKFKDILIGFIFFGGIVLGLIAVIAPWFK